MFVKKLVCFIFLVVMTFQVQLSAQNFDVEMLQRINANSSEFMRGYSRAIANTTTYVSVASILSVGAVGLIKNDNDLLKDALYLGINFGTNAAFTYGLKNAFNRPRPAISYPQLITPYEDVSSLSFPSGHTSEAFSTATAFSLKYPKWYVIAPAYFWAGSVSYSRMNLGVHYPSDVLAGALLGTGTAFLTFKVNQWIQNGQKKHELNLSAW